MTVQGDPRHRGLDPLASFRRIALKAGLDPRGKLVARRHHLATYEDGKQLAPGAKTGANEFPSGFAPRWHIPTSA